MVIHLAVNHGLGRHQIDVSDKDYNAYNKVRMETIVMIMRFTNFWPRQAIYTSQILKILILCLAKASLIMVFVRIIPSKPKRMVFKLLLVFVTLWGVATVIALAVQCKVPHPWNLTASRCSNQVSCFAFSTPDVPTSAQFFRELFTTSTVSSM